MLGPEIIVAEYLITRLKEIGGGSPLRHAGSIR